ncbi:WD40 repeat [Macleaya cordata]|uniref:WD40 repeat n=1 Tax=Macleaya cordata TaxID=56857 RepID=A0A200PMT7_MACCD|nr:WD40 repeat [Macleaya cordata]
MLKFNYLQKRISSSFPLCFLSSSTSRQTNYLDCLIDHFFTNPISDIKTLFQSHSFIITTGHSSNIFIAAKLISLYSSFNKPNFSTQVFNAIDIKDTFLWNSIIKSHFSNGDYPNALEIFSKMHFSQILPNPFTIPMVVAACAELSSFKYGQSIHCVALELGFLTGNAAVGSSFVYMYSKCNDMRDAFKMFDEMTVRDVVSWTALVIGYVQNDEWENGLDCIRKMHESSGYGENPNFRTIEGGLQACGNLGSLLSGRCLHGYAVKTGNGSSRLVQSSLLSMYAKCGNSEEAHVSFCEMEDKDLISWTTIIGVYARNECIGESLDLFWGMLVSEVDPDGIIISCILSGFGNSTRVNEGKAFHGMIIRRDFKLDQMVRNSLMSMYCKFGCLDLAEKLFDRLCEWDTESWNHMISGYSRLGLETKCLELFREMQHLRVEADVDSLVLVLSSCSQLVAMHLGRSVHCFVIKNGKGDNISISNSLVGMYGKCRNLTIARKLFCRVEKDIVTWNTLISAYTHNGHSSEALALFDQMVSADIKPNSVTLKIFLSACSHLAALEHGKRVHTYIKEMGLECDLSLVTALIDMYVKCGQLQLSREIFDMMPERDVISWNVMISGYGIHGDAKAAVELFQQMEELGVRPNGLSFLAVVSACAHAGLVKEGKYLFYRMKDYSIIPTLKHYACMVDLLGRAGNLREAEDLVQSMPIAPDGGVWGALLGSCKIHNNVEMGERVAKRAIESDPENDGYYIMMTNMYSSMGMWEKAEKMRGEMKKRGVRKRAGWSAIGTTHVLKSSVEHHLKFITTTGHSWKYGYFRSLERKSERLDAKILKNKARVDLQVEVFSNLKHREPFPRGICPCSGKMVQKFGEEEFPEVSRFPGMAQIIDKMGFASLTVWNMKTWKAMTVLPLGEDPPAITSLCFNYNGKILAASATDGMIHMFSILMSAGLQITGWPAHDSAMSSILFGPDETSIFSLGSDGKIFEWSLQNQGQVLWSRDSSRL